VDELVGRINGRFSHAGWVPVHYLYRSFPHAELVVFYREADVGLVTPLRDGMNLGAKEFVAAQGEDPGVLVLSKSCGAAETMKEALIVNPWDQHETARSIYRALRMPRGERIRRWEALNQSIRTFTAADWSSAFLSGLETA
jgi:trehalose 6-phosphate synthase